MLARFGLGEVDLLGAGSESWVYALDADRILRIRRRPTDPADIERVKHFLGWIAGRLPFDTPMIETIEPDGSTIEKRLAGRPMTAVLPGLEGEGRRRAFHAYFEAATAIRSIAMPDEPYGQLLAPRPLVAPEWTGFLAASLDRYVARHRAHLDAAFGDADALIAKAHALLAAVPSRPTKVLAHGDFFPGNVLMDDTLKVSGVVDFGIWTIVAAPDYDVAGAAMFAEVSNECGPDDTAFLRALLLEHCGAAAIPTLSFYRAYFAFALFEQEDLPGFYPKLAPWNLATLRQLADGTLADWAIPRP